MASSAPEAPDPGLQPHSRWILVAICAAVFSLALVARWSWSKNDSGPSFKPRPDALEYAASAQAIAQTGRFFLQVGPVQAPPHYSPGWPAVLAAALAAGAAPQDLWHVTGICGALLASLLALFARDLARGGANSPAVALGIGGAAGAVWALAPCAASAGSVLLSDEPTTLMAVLSLYCGFRAAQRLDGGRGAFPWAWLALAGAAFAVTLALRPVDGVLLVPAEATLALLAGRRRPRRSLALIAGAWAMGALLPMVATSALLTHSRWSPFEWTHYAYWAPRGVDSSFFSARFAWAGNAKADPFGKALPHGWLAASSVLGIPGLPRDWYLGRIWPLLAIPAGVALWREGRREGFSGAVPATGVAMVVWILGRLVFLSFFYYLQSRLLLASHAALLLLFSSALGRWLTAPPERARTRLRLALPALIALLVLVTLEFYGYATRIPSGARPDRFYKPFNAWKASSDAERAALPTPFDPLYAQALGELDPAALASIHAWGQLPPTLHVGRLIRKGLLPPSEARQPATDDEPPEK